MGNVSIIADRKVHREGNAAQCGTFAKGIAVQDLQPGRQLHGGQLHALIEGASLDLLQRAGERDLLQHQAAGERTTRDGGDALGDDNGFQIRLGLAIGKRVPANSHHLVAVQGLGDDQRPGVALVAGDGGVAVIIQRVVEKRISFTGAVLALVIAAARPAVGAVGRIVGGLPAGVSGLGTGTLRYLHAVFVVMRHTVGAVVLVEDHLVDLQLCRFEEQKLYAALKTGLRIDMGAEIHTGTGPLRRVLRDLHRTLAAHLGVYIEVKNGKVGNAELGDNADLAGHVRSQGKLLAVEALDQTYFVAYTALHVDKNTLLDMEVLGSADAACQRGLQRDLQAADAGDAPVAQQQLLFQLDLAAVFHLQVIVERNKRDTFPEVDIVLDSRVGDRGFHEKGHAAHLHRDLSVQLDIGLNNTDLPGGGAGQRVGLEFLIQLLHIVAQLRIAQRRDLGHVRLHDALGVDGCKGVLCGQRRCLDAGHAALLGDGFRRIGHRDAVEVHGKQAVHLDHLGAVRNGDDRRTGLVAVFVDPRLHRHLGALRDHGHVRLELVGAVVALGHGGAEEHLPGIRHHGLRLIGGHGLLRQEAAIHQRKPFVVHRHLNVILVGDVGVVISIGIFIQLEGQAVVQRVCRELSRGRLLRPEFRTGRQVDDAELYRHHQVAVVIGGAVDVRIVVVGVVAALHGHPEGIHQHLHPFDPGHSGRLIPGIDGVGELQPRAVGQPLVALGTVGHIHGSDDLAHRSAVRTGIGRYAGLVVSGLHPIMEDGRQAGTCHSGIYLAVHRDLDFPVCRFAFHSPADGHTAGIRILHIDGGGGVSRFGILAALCAPRGEYLSRVGHLFRFGFVFAGRRFLPDRFRRDRFGHDRLSGRLVRCQLLRHGGHRQHRHHQQHGHQQTYDPLLHRLLLLCYLSFQRGAPHIAPYFANTSVPPAGIWGKDGICGVLHEIPG